MLQYDNLYNLMVKVHELIHSPFRVYYTRGEVLFMENKNNNVDRGNLKQNLSEKFVWAIAYGSCIGWGAFILPGD